MSRSAQLVGRSCYGITIATIALCHNGCYHSDFSVRLSNSISDLTNASDEGEKRTLLALKEARESTGSLNTPQVCDSGLHAPPAGRPGFLFTYWIAERPTVNGIRIYWNPEGIQKDVAFTDYEIKENRNISKLGVVYTHFFEIPRNSKEERLFQANADTTVVLLLDGKVVSAPSRVRIDASWIANRNE